MRYIDLLAKRLAWIYSAWLLLVMLVPKLFANLLSVDGISNFLKIMGLIIIVISLLFGMLAKGHGKYPGELMIIALKQPVLIISMLIFIIGFTLIYSAN